MSEREWAAIIYGRSYHLDFRFITVPHNFQGEDINWAAQYIVATTQQARKLADSPRWSLFKNNSYCVVGVTCMVRNLIGKLREDLLPVMAKDDQGRPLYVFVGYVTELSTQRNIHNFPPYTAECLDDFQILYQEIEPVWLAKNYEQHSRHPILSQYQPRKFAESGIAPKSHQIEQLNHLAKYPNKTYLWPSQRQQNNLLWLASIECSQPTSTCLNIEGKTLGNSPFLNQSINQLEQFQIQERIVDTVNDRTPEKSHYQANSSLSQKIAHRAQEDIDLTLQQATKVARVSQDLFNNFTDWSNPPYANSEQQTNTSANETESFGFKSKKSSPSNNHDWF